MQDTECPHCSENSIRPLARWIAGHWKDIYCPRCEGRIAMQPIVLALLYFVYVWNVLFFGFMAWYESSWVYAALLIVGAIILEVFIYYIPLVRLRRKKPKPDLARE